MFTKITTITTDNNEEKDKCLFGKILRFQKHLSEKMEMLLQKLLYETGIQPTHALLRDICNDTISMQV